MAQQNEGVGDRPFGVSLVLDIVLALSQGVPELDGLVARSRNDLSVVCAEADRQDVRCVANKAAGSGASVEIPKTKGVVPRGRQSELSIGGDDNV